RGGRDRRHRDRRGAPRARRPRRARRPGGGAAAAGADGVRGARRHVRRERRAGGAPPQVRSHGGPHRGRGAARARPATERREVAVHAPRDHGCAAERAPSVGPREAGVVMSDREALKRRAAERALDWVEDGMVLGLGTGSTVRHFLELLGERLRDGALKDVTGVPTSWDTAERATALGIPLVTLEERPRLDLAVDGADEVDPGLDLIKGLGGALLWEKIVAAAAGQLVIIVDDSKLVQRLGEKAPLPVEVVPFGWTTHLSALERLGARAVL